QEFFREALASGGALLALDRRDGQVIGSSRFHGYDPAASEIGIGWTVLAPAHWGGAHNGGMKRVMLPARFPFVSNVTSQIGVRNFRSQRAVEKIGAVRVGARPDSRGRESFIYRITADDFSQGLS